VIYELPVESSARPADWIVQSLAQLADVVGGGTPDTSVPKYWNPPEIPWVTPTDITACSEPVLTRAERAISADGLRNSSAALLPVGSTLLTSRATIGECRLAGIPVATNQGFASLMPKDGVDSRFLFYLAQTITPTLVRLAAGTTFMEVSRREIRRVNVCVPSAPAERAAIGRIGAAADDALEIAKSKLNAAQRLKTALMQQLFSDGVPGRHARFNETKLGRIPEGWEVLKLKKCGVWGSGGTPDRDNKAFWGGTIPWIKSGEVDYRPITDTDEKITEVGAVSINGELLPVGTLLIAMYGAGVTRGKAALLGIRAYINQAIAFFKGNEQTDNEWLLYWFERNYERVRTLAGGANQDNLSLYLIKNLEIARPRREEQSQIVSILNDSSNVISTSAAEILALDRVKRSILQNLLTGRVRVRV
jgi:type I restriction enzyme S subunit